MTRDSLFRRESAAGGLEEAVAPTANPHHFEGIEGARYVARRGQTGRVPHVEISRNGVTTWEGSASRLEERGVDPPRPRKGTL